MILHFPGDRPATPPLLELFLGGLRPFIPSSGTSVRPQGPAVGIHMLVEAGLPVDTPDNQGITALHLAAQNERYSKGKEDEWKIALVPLLLSLGADPASVDNEGRTPLDYARERVERYQNAMNSEWEDDRRNLKAALQAQEILEKYTSGS